MKTVSSILAAILILFPFAGLYAANNQDAPSAPKKEKTQLIEVEAEGFALYQNRQKDIRFGTIGNSPVISANNDYNAKPLQFDTDHWGGGYGIRAAFFPENRLSFETSFEQYFISKKQVLPDVPGQNLTLLTYIPFLDGKPKFEPTSGRNLFGFAVTGNSSTFDLAFGRVEFSYDEQYDAIHLTPSYRLIKKPGISVNIYAGPSFAYFDQKFLLETSGQNAAFPGATSNAQAFSNTREILKDFLYGGRVGIKGKSKLFKGLFISMNEACDLYFRQSRLWGRQDINNGASGSNVAPIIINDSIHIRTHSYGFTPHLESKAELGYDFGKHFTIKGFYEFDGWLNLSQVQNIVISSNAYEILESPTHIEGTGAYAHYVGGSITVKF